MSFSYVTTKLRLAYRASEKNRKLIAHMQLCVRCVAVARGLEIVHFVCNKNRVVERRIRMPLASEVLRMHLQINAKLAKWTVVLCTSYAYLRLQMNGSGRHWCDVSINSLVGTQCCSTRDHYKPILCTFFAYKWIDRTEFLSVSRKPYWMEADASIHFSTHILLGLVAGKWPSDVTFLQQWIDPFTGGDGDLSQSH